jgi:hypothetical protein
VRPKIYVYYNLHRVGARRKVSALMVRGG